jgi:fumarate hydratase class I
MTEFVYQDPLPLAADTTKYRLLTSDHVSVTHFEGEEILKIEPQALDLVAREALRECSFLLRTAHLEKVAAILDDPEATPNDRYVALAMLRNAEVSARFVLPFCQDTGTATVFAKKGQRVWTGGRDAEWLSRGIHAVYQKENLRYSQSIPLQMYEEKNSGTNLPAQIDLFAADGMKYEFLFVAKGGGSANKMFLFQETQGGAEPDRAAEVPEREDEDARHRRLSAVSPGVRDRRTSAEYCMKGLEARQHRLSRRDCPTSG